MSYWISEDFVNFGDPINKNVKYSIKKIFGRRSNDLYGGSVSLPLHAR